MITEALTYDFDARSKKLGLETFALVFHVPDENTSL